MAHTIKPHGGILKNLYVPKHEIAAKKQEANEYRSWDLNRRQLCDIELILNGAFSPLEGFIGQKDYESVLDTLQLADGTLWPMPITLDVDKAFAEQTQPGSEIALRDPEGVLIAIMQVEDIWQPDKQKEAEKIFETTDPQHPGSFALQNQTNEFYIGGKLQGIEAPAHYDFKQHRHTPAELRTLFTKLGWSKVVAFQTRNPMHRAHVELTFQAARQVEANLLIHPTVGLTKPGDIDHYSRVRCYEHIMQKYPEKTTMLSLLPLAMRMAGPRETLWHALIRKNYGCGYFIVGRDHAGPGKDGQGEDFYKPYAAQALAAEHQKALGIEIIAFEDLVYLPEKAGYRQISEVKDGEQTLSISGSELRRRLQQDLPIPDWFSYPEVVEELRKTYPPRSRQGFTVFLTGLSGAGKSTIANALQMMLLEVGDRRITLLDGDIVRKNLSSELGFSREHRDLNILRIGFVANEITKNGGVAICAPIAPYRHTRRAVRKMIEENGVFVEVHVSTPLETCEQRDRKGLYAKARAGAIKGFTGIDDPYETPEHAELSIDTSQLTADEAAHQVVLKLENMGLISLR